MSDLTKVYPPRRPVLGLKPISRNPVEVGPLGYGMLYDAEGQGIPTIPGQIHSSLFQKVLVHRWQISSYISRLRNFGLRPDYPAAHVMSIINSGPSNPGGNPVGVSRFGRPLQKGTMKSMPRFGKALPVTQVPYVPPEY
jgi:hypothetical protein